MQTAVLGLVLAVCSFAPTVYATVETYDVPIDMARCYGYYKKKTKLSKTPAGAIQSVCDNIYSWMHAKELNINRLANTKTKSYVVNLFQNTKRYIKDHKIRRKRQAVVPPPKLRLRKEIRMMSDHELNTFFRAVNSAKRNTTIEPNKYDALAEFHTGMTSVSAHGGCNFHGWHRMYILMFENALREEGPEFENVTVPYWDSRLENRMEGVTPMESALFSDRLMGSCQGRVVGGIMGADGWDSSTGMITRNCGTDGPLMNDGMIHNVTRRTRFGEICGEDSEIDDDLEFNHNGVHRWIDGQMAMLQSAVYDPIFWIHHTFIDLIWESFRENQRRAGVDPETDFPPNPTTMGAFELHLPDAKMGFADLDVLDGLSNMFTTEWYRYAPPPTCNVGTRDCGSKYLKCVVDTPANIPRARCVARTLQEVLDWEEEQRKPVVQPCIPPTHENKTKPPLHIGTMPVQNTFCMNGQSDIGQWVYIPVKIIVRRPPDYITYGSYPVSRGKLEKQNGDIYSPSAYSNVYRHLRNVEQPAKYESCLEPDTDTNTIYVKSVGLNYEGIYKEYAIIDRRLAVTIATAYIAVRKPMSATDVSVSMLHAQDTCGRVCKPICKVPGTEIFRPCSGAVKVTGSFPLQFGNSFGDAVLNVWDFNQDKDCPQLSTDSMIVSFYCDYKTDWVWPTVEPLKRAPPKTIQVVDPPAELKPTTITPGCSLGWGCMINKPCAAIANCQHGELLDCMKSCHKFARCLNGSFYIHQCRRGERYISGQGCVRGFCDYRTSGMVDNMGNQLPPGLGRRRGRRALL